MDSNQPVWRPRQNSPARRSTRSFAEVEPGSAKDLLNGTNTEPKKRIRLAEQLKQTAEAYHQTLRQAVAQIQTRWQALGISQWQLGTHVGKLQSVISAIEQKPEI